MRNALSKVLSGIMAGISIAMGCVAYLACESPVVGALFFSLGLFLVLVNGFGLFTGMVCYAIDNPPKYIITLLLTILGNFIGATAIGLLIRLTRLEALYERAFDIMQLKLSGGVLSILILSALCNALIFFSVDIYKNCPHGVGKYLGILLPIPAFIICGYEHCVANMFYIAAAGDFTLNAYLTLLLMILGNAIGGILTALGKRGATQKKATK